MRERERGRDNARFDFQVSVPRRGGGYLRSPDYRDPLARRSGGPQLAPLCTRCVRKIESVCVCQNRCN